MSHPYPNAGSRCSRRARDAPSAPMSCWVRPALRQIPQVLIAGACLEAFPVSSGTRRAGIATPVFFGRYTKVRPWLAPLGNGWRRRTGTGVRGRCPIRPRHQHAQRAPSVSLSAGSDPRAPPASARLLCGQRSRAGESVGSMGKRNSDRGSVASRFSSGARDPTRRSRSRSQSSEGAVGSPTGALVPWLPVAISARRRWSRSRSSPGS
jgi:hypothetical protein